jgi:sulfide:quinone oxidoreductase
MEDKMAKVLVLGGGLGGVETAIWLRKYGFEVDLISDREYLYIFPISIWIPFGEISFDDAKIPLAQLAKVHGFNLIIDKVTGIWANKKVVEGEKEDYTDFDYLVIAIGGKKLRPKGIENTLSICGDPIEAVKIKEKIEELVKKGSGKVAFGFGGNPKDPSGVRGGPAFEVMFNFHNYLKKKGLRDKFEITFFAPMPRPGARMGEKPVKMMDIMFKRLNIKKITGKKIKEFQPDGVLFEDDSKLESDFTMFIPALGGHPVFKNSDLPLNEGGFIKINEYCEVLHNFDETSTDKFPIFAIGDSSAICGPDWRAKQGHLAEVMARVTAYNIREMEHNSDKRKEYISHINIICLMDTGDGGALVYRSHTKTIFLPLPIIGHWLKKGWGWYYKNSKLGKIPRIPGM